MKIPHIVFCILFFVSCSNQSHYSTLQQADSLMNQHLDSAYQLIKDINPNDLSAKDKAYHSLLYTQAQYKTYDTIHSDSLIDIAVDYYTENPDGDKLTKAFIYKGAALSDMGSYREAINWSKKAEQICDTTDYLTLGLINTRMGELYQKTFIVNLEDLEKYKKALIYYRKINHKTFENYSLSSIGQLYRLKNNDSAYYYINKSIQLDKERNDSSHLFHDLSLLAELYNRDHKYNEAKNTALYVINNRSTFHIGNSSYSAVSKAYAKLGLIDSAMYYAKQFPLTTKFTDTMRYYMVLEDIAVAKNDYESAYQYDNLSTKIGASIIKQARFYDIYSAEKQFDNQVANDQAKQYRSQVTARNYLILIVFLIGTILILLSIAYWKRKKRLLIQNQQLVDQLQTELLNQQTLTQDILEKNVLSISNLNKTINEKEALENSLKKIVEDRMSVLRNIMNIKYQFGDKPEKFIQQFDKIIAVNKKLPKESDSIIRIANQLYDNIIDYIDSEHYGLLSYGDKLMLSLICLEFSPIEMTVFLNCPNPTAMYSQRYRLGKKLRTSSLEAYIAHVKRTLSLSKKLEKTTRKQQS